MARLLNYLAVLCCAIAFAGLVILFIDAVWKVF